MSGSASKQTNSFNLEALLEIEEHEETVYMNEPHVDHHHPAPKVKQF